MKRHQYWVGILCGGIVAIIAVLYAIAGYAKATNLDNEFSLPLLTISGVVALLGVLALTAIIFSKIELTDPSQALGLPSGSVRAVIALSLIVLFAILSVYLFSSLASRKDISKQPCLTAAERTEFLTNFPVGQFRYSVQMAVAEAQSCPQLPKLPDAAGAPAAEPPKPVADGQPSKQDAKQTPTEPRYVVTYASSNNAASEDFAKQLLVLIGTLVTSVAGFYFGAQSVSQAQQSLAGALVFPVASGVDPSELQVGAGQEFNVIGSNLNTINQVKLTAGTSSLIATSVTSNTGRVHATITVPPDSAYGPWDVVVSDPQGHSDRVPQALYLGTAPAGTPGADAILDHYLNAGDLTPEMRQERMRNIQSAAAAVGLADVTVASFIRDTTDDAKQNQAAVVRRLGLSSGALQ